MDSLLPYNVFMEQAVRCISSCLINSLHPPLLPLSSQIYTIIVE